MEAKTWFEAFNNHMNPIFTKEDFETYKKGVLEELEHYQKYLKQGAKILDVGCGVGCIAVPLSFLGYKVVGIDNDSRVVEAAQKNGRNFGKDIKILKGDIFKLTEYFEKDSFDGCISGGLLEHFKKEDIKKLVTLQLELAPLVIASMPVKTERTMKQYGFTEETALNHHTADGICRNFWSENEWVSNVLGDFTIIEHFVETVNFAIGNFDEVFIVIKRALSY